MASVTLSTIRTRAQRKAGHENLALLTTAEWNENINSRGRELHGLLTHAGLFFDRTVQSITATGSTTGYALDAAVFSIQAVTRVDVTGQPEVPLVLVQPRERPYGLVGEATGYEPAGSRVYLWPMPASGTYKVYYTPDYTALSADGDTLAGYNGWENYVVYGAAMDALAKEGDLQGLAAVKLLFDAEIARIERERQYRAMNQPARIVAVRDSVALDPASVRWGRPA